MGRLRELAVETSTYSTQMGGIYVFNLIVGAGALAMPQAFGLSGYLAGSILLAVLAIFSFITVTFVNEAMAMANAYARNAPSERSVQQPETEATRLIGAVSLPSSSGSSKSAFDIRSRMEMGAMAEMFFSKFGVQLFYTCIIVYLYGDLCIYGNAPVTKPTVEVGQRRQTLLCCWYRCDIAATHQHVARVTRVTHSCRSAQVTTTCCLWQWQLDDHWGA
eukprot:m.209089 g.209089  ORF g.209089 m.209089 type:complete len:219 (-) comp18544_c0_seq6:5226-5882(-)